MSVGDVLQIVVDIQGFDPVAFLFLGNQNYIFGPFDDHFGVALFWAPS